MTDYLQRLIRRLDRPVQIDSWPTRLTPFTPALKAGDEPDEAFEEVKRVSLAEEPISYKASPVEPGMEPIRPPSDPLDFSDSASRPVETMPAAPPAFTRSPAEFAPITNPMRPDLPATETNLQAFEKSPPITRENLEQVPHPSRTLRIEKEAPKPSKPVAEKSFPALSAGSPPDLSNDVQPASRRKMPAEKPADPATPIPPIAPNSREPVTGPIALEQRQLKKDHTRSGQRPSEAQAGPSPTPPTDPEMAPTLHPTPAPSPPGMPQPDRPRLVIGRLQVEVVSSPQASPPATSPAKPFRRAPSPTPVRQPLRSKLRFGIGQL